MDTLGNRLRTQRNLKKLSQELLAARVKEICGDDAGVTRQTISYWESGKVTPRVDNLDAIAKVLGVTTDYLMGRVDSPLPTGTVQTADPLKIKKEPECGLQRANPEDGIRPESVENIVILPVVNYSELIEEEASIMHREATFIPSSLVSGFDIGDLYFLSQDIPFRMAESGPIPAHYGAIANKGFSFKNSKIYVVAFRSRQKVCRVTRYPDGSVDLADDSGTITLTPDEQKTTGYRILAKIENAVKIESIDLS